MSGFKDTFQPDRTRDGEVRLHFTPAEWRQILEDREFLMSSDNRFELPRLLMGVPVSIVPDHQFG